MKSKACGIFLAALAYGVSATPALAIAEVNPPPPGQVWVERWVADFEQPASSVFGPWNNRNGSGIHVDYYSGPTMVAESPALPGFGERYFLNYGTGYDSGSWFGLGGFGDLAAPGRMLKLQFDLAFLDAMDVTGSFRSINFNLGNDLYTLNPAALQGEAQLIGYGNYALDHGTDAVVRYEFLLPFVEEFMSFGFQLASPDQGGSARWGVDNIRLFTSNAAVPEPSTWTLLIAGFGFIGLAMRRKQRTVVVSS